MIQKNYSFTKPIIKGKPTRYLQVLFYLYKYGATLKKDLVFAVWGKPKSSFDHVFDYGCYTYKDNMLRGYFSQMFAEMTSAGLITYNKRDKKRIISENGIDYIKSLMSKYSKAYIESLFIF